MNLFGFHHFNTIVILSTEMPSNGSGRVGSNSGKSVLNLNLTCLLIGPGMLGFKTWIFRMGFGRIHRSKYERSDLVASESGWWAYGCTSSTQLVIGLEMSIQMHNYQDGLRAIWVRDCHPNNPPYIHTPLKREALHIWLQLFYLLHLRWHFSSLFIFICMLQWNPILSLHLEKFYSHYWGFEAIWGCHSRNRFQRSISNFPPLFFSFNHL